MIDNLISLSELYLSNNKMDKDGLWVDRKPMTSSLFDVTGVIDFDT